jgi:hypothetical protein
MSKGMTGRDGLMDNIKALCRSSGPHATGRESVIEGWVGREEMHRRIIVERVDDEGQTNGFLASIIATDQLLCHSITRFR